MDLAIPDKFKALLTIAHSVQQGGKKVTESQIEKAKGLGATDVEIHDTVLIAATFCLFNRYLDGLNVWDSQTYTPEMYRERGRMIAEGLGYAPKH